MLAIVGSMIGFLAMIADAFRYLVVLGHLARRKGIYLARRARS